MIKTKTLTYEYAAVWTAGTRIDGSKIHKISASYATPREAMANAPKGAEIIRIRQAG